MPALRGVPSTEAVEADVELTGVGEGEEDDDAPLLRNFGMATPADGAPASPGVHPLPNSSYTRDSHSWASKLVFSWVDPVLEKSRGGRELQLGDTLLLPDGLTADVLSERFRHSWEGLVSGGRPSLASAFRALFFREYFVAGAFRLLTELAKIAAPMVLREVILFVEGKATAVPNNVTGGLALALYLLLLLLLQACALQHFIHGVFVVGAGVNTVATVAVFDKALRLSRASLEGPRLGQALNFQAKDASKLREFVVFFHNLWAAPLTALGCTLLLLRVVGASALVGVSLIPVLIPLETWVAKRSAKYRKGVLKVSDARISLIGEIIDGIKTVKLNSLDHGFKSKVELLRAKELASIRQALTLNAYNQAVMRSSPIVVTLATFAAYVLSGHELDAQTAFTSLALFGTIGHPFHVLPKAVQLLADAKVSLRRLEAFLLEGKPCLEHVTAEMRRGLSVVVGPIGCGKSTLLSGLVEHLPVRAEGGDKGWRENGGGGGRSGGGERGMGEVTVVAPDKRVAFCPDTPWIVNASARDNICLGFPAEAFDEVLYRRCVEACALERDFGEWEEGDRAIIGARGITVSGGQKARIALARAMYSRCYVVLLDDPLSALDNIVGGWVFRRAVLEMARDAAVVMTTHQPQYMRKGDCELFSVSGGALALRANGEEQVQGVEEQDTFLKATGLSTAVEGAEMEKPALAKATGEAHTPPAATANKPANATKPAEAKATDKTGSSMSTLSAKVNGDRARGGVSRSVYIGYLKACGAVVVSVALAISVVAQLVDVSKEIVLAYWSDSRTNRPGLYLTWYSLVCLSVVAMNVARFFVVCWLGLCGSESLHRSLLSKVMGAPLPFFQVTDNGRITSRFASDFDSIDLAIPTSLSSFMDAAAYRCQLIFGLGEAALTMVAAVGVVVGASPGVLFAIFPVALAYHRVQRTYRMAAKELKRLDSATKSPIYSHFQETLDGLSSIQAYAIEQNMRRKNFFTVDANARARLTWDATNRWLGIRLDLLGALVVFLATLMAVVAGRSSPGMVGLGLSYALTITRTLSFGVRSSTALENQFNSVERVQEFIGLAQEEDDSHKVKASGPATRRPWPSSGIELRDVDARHRPDLPLVLNGVTLSVKCGERVGICGRSGSGKSSLALALVRVVECCRGGVFLDGQDIRELPLALLRSGVTVISQDAHLFSGNVREAIDPVGQCSDARIWEIIEMVGLRDAVVDLPLGLATSVSERGANWSAGQRQLLCIARAMVNQPGVLVFDEATANVDAHTDSLIRQLIQSRLNQAAVVVIAHRLEDVISCHRVAVMSAGAIAEEGEPSVLLAEVDSMLSLLARELGPELERKLRDQHMHLIR
ncbi:similar to canalicular multispecific organic anion transporter [Ectocarpus siliculosus]|uniref:Similar to canalicular multispecific organic anion transporter n=1 Tax=Ectocarpus siliculosus TaxID=2880 RepID=D8LHA4_ECTSI|nr:similar to canalicular multispecific organic anion transporter [Ectocarpus siliculosus]|eukprot:CBN74323.1 similar to canalicular multispecific organic anion transporter [Ectocarpus siliculosus]